MSDQVVLGGRPVFGNEENLEAVLPYASREELRGVQEHYERRGRDLFNQDRKVLDMEETFTRLVEQYEPLKYQDPEGWRERRRISNEGRSAVQEILARNSQTRARYGRLLEKVAEERETGFGTLALREVAKVTAKALSPVMAFFPEWKAYRGLSDPWARYTPEVTGSLVGGLGAGNRYVGSFFSRQMKDAFEAATGDEGGWWERFEAGGGAFGLVESGILTLSLGVQGIFDEEAHAVMNRGGAVEGGKYVPAKALAFASTLLSPTGVGKAAQLTGKGLKAVGAGRAVVAVEKGATAAKGLFAGGAALKGLGAAGGAVLGAAQTEGDAFERLHGGLFGALAGFGVGAGAQFFRNHPRVAFSGGGAAYGLLTGEDFEDRFTKAAALGALGYGAARMLGRAKILRSALDGKVTPDAAGKLLAAADTALPTSRGDAASRELLQASNSPTVRTLVEQGRMEEARTLFWRERHASRNTELVSALQDQVSELLSRGDDLLFSLAARGKESKGLREGVLTTILDALPDEVKARGVSKPAHILPTIHVKWPRLGLALDPRGKFHPRRGAVALFDDTAKKVAKQLERGEATGADLDFDDATLTKFRTTFGLDSDDAAKELFYAAVHRHGPFRAGAAALLGEEVVRPARATSPALYKPGDVIEMPRHTRGGASPIRAGRVVSVEAEEGGYAYVVERLDARTGKPTKGSLLRVREDRVPGLNKLARVAKEEAPEAAQKTAGAPESSAAALPPEKTPVAALAPPAASPAPTPKKLSLIEIERRPDPEDIVEDAVDAMIDYELEHGMGDKLTWEGIEEIRRQAREIAATPLPTDPNVGKTPQQIGREAQETALRALGYGDDTPIPLSRLKGKDGNAARSAIIREGIQASDPASVKVWAEYVEQPGKETQERWTRFLSQLEEYRDITDVEKQALTAGARKRGIGTTGAKSELDEALAWFQEHQPEFDADMLHRYYKGKAAPESFLRRVRRQEERLRQAIVDQITKDPATTYEKAAAALLARGFEKVPRSLFQRVLRGWKKLGGGPEGALILAPIAPGLTPEEEDEGVTWKMAAIAGALFFGRKVGTREATRLVRTHFEPVGIEAGTKIVRGALKEKLARVPAEATRAEAGHLTQRLNEILRDDGTIQAAASLITGEVKDVPHGAESVVLRMLGEVVKLTDGAHFRDVSAANTPRLPFVLQPTHVMQLGRYTVSRYPRILVREDFERAGRSRAEFDQYVELLRGRLAKRGFMADTHPGNVGLVGDLEKGRLTPYLIDAGILEREAGPGMAKAINRIAGNPMRFRRMGLSLLGGAAVAGAVVPGEEEDEQEPAYAAQQAGFGAVLEPLFKLLRSALGWKKQTRDLDGLAREGAAKLILGVEKLSARLEADVKDRDLGVNTRALIEDLKNAATGADRDRAEMAGEVARGLFPERAGGTIGLTAYLGDVSQRATDPLRSGPLISRLGNAFVERSFLRERFVDPVEAVIRRSFKAFEGKDVEKILRVVDEGLVDSADARWEKLSPLEQEMGFMFREVFEDLIEMQNKVRLARGEKVIPRTENYMPHLFRNRISDDTWRGSHEKVARDVWNRYAKRREGQEEGFVKDPFDVLDDYFRVVTRDALYGGLIRDFNQMAPLMSEPTANMLRQAFEKEAGMVRNAVDVGVTDRAYAWMEKKGIVRDGRTAKRKFENTLQTITMLEYAKGLGGSAKSVALQSMQLLFTQFQVDPKHSIPDFARFLRSSDGGFPGMVGGGMAGYALSDEDDSNLEALGKIAGGALAGRKAGKLLSLRAAKKRPGDFEDMKGIMEKVLVVDRAKMTEQEAEMAIAHSWLQRMIDHPIALGSFKEAEMFNRRAAAYLGWQDGLRKGLTGTELVDHARRVVGASQFHYLAMSAPGILRAEKSPLGSRLAKPLIPFASFPFRALDVFVNQAERWGAARKAGDMKTAAAIRNQTLAGLTGLFGVMFAARAAGVDADDDTGVLPFEALSGMIRDRSLGGAVRPFEFWNGNGVKLIVSALENALGNPRAEPLGNAALEFITPTQGKRMADYLELPALGIRAERLAPLGAQGDMVYLTRSRGQARGGNVIGPASGQDQALSLLGFRPTALTGALDRERDIRQESEAVETEKMRLLTKVKVMILRDETDGIEELVHELRGYYTTRSKMLDAISFAVASAQKPGEQRALEQAPPVLRERLRLKVMGGER